MILNLEVNDDIVRKIKGLSALSGHTASEITQFLGNQLEGLVTQEIARSIGLYTAEDPKLPQTPPDPDAIRQESMSEQSTKDLKAFIGVSDDEEPSEAPGLIFPEPTIYSEEEIDETLRVADSLSDENFDDLDQELPQTEEPVMGVKDKQGNETEYEDDIMSDAQEMADNDGYEYMSDPAPSVSAAKRAGALVSNVNDFASDAPVSDGGERVGPDTLPLDLGIDSVAGDTRKGADFFNQIMSGVQGDKSQRNTGLRRVRR